MSHIRSTYTCAVHNHYMYNQPDTESNPHLTLLLKVKLSCLIHEVNEKKLVGGIIRPS